ncbi:MAG: GNAT family N-acetyltransferase [bacterium]
MRTQRGMMQEGLIEVRRLIDICNKHEDLDLSINLEAGPDPANTPNQFLQYHGDSLVGILSFQGNREIEMCLAVHPDHRRKGIGRGLLKTAREEVRRRGRSDLLLVCEETSRSGRAFVKAVEAQYRFSEYRMRLDPRTAPGRQPTRGPVRLRQAGARDADVVARLISVSFNRSEEEERARVAQDIERSSHRFFLAQTNGEPVGSVGIAAVDRRVYIIAFNVLPEFRGRGYGRQMLAQTVDTLRGEAWEEILIEVATENRGALTLYRSCGFREVTSYGYYQLDR